MLIKRARGHRLYSEKNEKILDLSMDSGRAVIGHRPNGVSLALKNAIDRGVYAPMDNKFFARLKKELNRMFPDYPHLTLLHSQESLNIDPSDIVDPLFNSTLIGEFGYWRPFVKTPDADNLIVLYPLPGLNTTTVVISKDERDVKSHNISPVLLSAILRSLYDYQESKKRFNPELYTVFQGIKGARIVAPYIVIERDDYKELCCSALKEGVLLNSESNVNVLPPDFSEGEIKKILDVLG